METETPISMTDKLILNLSYKRQKEAYDLMCTHMHKKRNAAIVCLLYNEADEQLPFYVCYDSTTGVRPQMKKFNLLVEAHGCAWILATEFCWEGYDDLILRDFVLQYAQ